MNIYEIVTNKLQNASKEKVIKQIGYHSTKKGLKAIDTFLTSKNLYDWLNSGFYDFKYNSIGLFEQLCMVFEIDNGDIQAELQEQKVYSRELDKFKNSYIFVNTNFNRANQPIFALAFCESNRRIKLAVEELIFKTDADIFSIISKTIEKHYLETSGNIGIWGNIQNYLYHHSDNITYVFSVDGIKQENILVNETRATLTLSGKII